MSRQLISRSPDLKRLQDDGYEVAVKAGFLVVSHVPYVDADRKVRIGELVSELSLAGDITTKPSTHVVMFAGSTPCDSHGTTLQKVINQSGQRVLGEGLVIDHTFSSKPVDSSGYADYHEKITAYAEMLSGPAQAIDPTATARTYRVVVDDNASTPFLYSDTATARAGIGRIADKLKTARIAIVGLGGTGSYILDLVAKAAIDEIHLFDGDRLLQHNVFRAPGAPSIDDLAGGPNKANYYAAIYSRMRRGMIAHPYFVDEATVDELMGIDFIFLALDLGPAKQLIVTRLEEAGISFIDVGMGVAEEGDALGGIVRVTTSTSDHPAGPRGRIPFSDGAAENDYSQNIQIADLNALNAALAVIKWKKLVGFYRDLENEHFSAYTIDGNHLLNDDQA
jgi:hypothetical protein